MARSAGIVQMQRILPHKAVTPVDGFPGPQFKSVNGLLVHWEGLVHQLHDFDPSLAPHAISHDLTPRAAISEPSPIISHLQMVFDSLLTKEFCTSWTRTSSTATEALMRHAQEQWLIPQQSTTYAFEVRKYLRWLPVKRLMASKVTPKEMPILVAYTASFLRPDGTLLGKIEIPGGVVKFSFTRKIDIKLLNENTIWLAKTDERFEGDLLVAEES
ncbi:hypothetical protein D0869_05508 [Hortaea werneckii]|uniref:Uncharacterized protein n=1 Tax=Hortaea werneckii TaxID=91943 RepID=A0A3M7B8Q1_HORWE|nr:hypothetical protein D0869_05508 [Hortaea werneckii]RMY07232.1 hypothetical protein D0868_05459 [Hortaea werneckii]RMY16557.1 hypothetical protein D0867_06479 [Hortaea werneckii]RMY36018.1 hypothetical protein D0866_04211 [Hortaea werneckii]